MTTRRTVLRAGWVIPAAALLGACRPGTSPAAAPAAAGRPTCSWSRRPRVSPSSTPGRAGWSTCRGPEWRVATARDRDNGLARRAHGSAGKPGDRVPRSTTSTSPGDLSARVVAPGGTRVALVAGAKGDSGGHRTGRPAGARRPSSSPTSPANASGSPCPATSSRRRSPPPAAACSCSTTCRRPRRTATGSGWSTSPPQGPAAADPAEASRCPAGAEEEMRGEGRQAVYHPGRQTCCSRSTPTSRTTCTPATWSAGARQRRAARARVRALACNLREQWAYCVDLPAPFGEHPAAGHAIALSPDGSRVAVVDASTAAVAYVDPQELVVSSTGRFDPPAGAGAAPPRRASATGGQLVVAAGREVVVVTAAGAGPRWSCAGPSAGSSFAPAPGGCTSGRPTRWSATRWTPARCSAGRRCPACWR